MKKLVGNIELKNCVDEFVGKIVWKNRMNNSVEKNGWRKLWDRLSGKFRLKKWVER